MISFPFVIGVTGHRDLSPASLRPTRDAVKSVLQDLSGRLASVELQIVCGMASGADQLVAEVALELGLEVHALLPMPLEMYRNDFAGEELVSFERLITDPRIKVREMPLPSELAPGAADVQGPERDKLYGRLGDFLVRRANLLVALWDGRVNGLQGGTGDVVLRYLEASPDEAPYSEALDILAGEEKQAGAANVAVQIRVDRGEECSDHAGEISYLSGGIGLGRIARFNDPPRALEARLDALRHHITEHHELEEAGKLGPGWSLLEGLDKRSIPGRLLERLQQINDVYLRVDALALYNQRRSDRTFAAFALMAGTMGLLFLLYAKIAAAKFFLIGYLLLFAVGYLAYRVIHRRQWFTRHLVYRVAAESLRVHFFMALCGTDDRKDLTRLLDLTGICRFPGFGWLGDALRIATPLTDDPQPLDEERVVLAQRLWVEDQAGYFERKVHQLHLGHERLEKIKHALFVVSFVGVVGLVLFKGLLVDTRVTAELDLKTLLVFLMGLLPLWLGIWEIYQNKMAVRELLWQYRAQAELFNAAYERLQARRTLEEARGILQDIADRSLHEVYLWAIHRFHREHEPPSAG